MNNKKEMDKYLGLKRALVFQKVEIETLRPELLLSNEENTVQNKQVGVDQDIAKQLKHLLDGCD
jgi:hypothetical protein